MPGKKKVKPRAKSSGPKAFALSEEMKRWATLLSAEVATWPRVERKKMFGMTSFYRGRTIFAAIPDKKAFFSPTSVIFKLQSPTVRQQKWMVHDPRIKASFGIGQKWYGYELQSEADIHGALEWLGEAFDAAGVRRPA